MITTNLHETEVAETEFLRDQQRRAVLGCLTNRPKARYAKTSMIRKTIAAAYCAPAPSAFANDEAELRVAQEAVGRGILAVNTHRAGCIAPGDLAAAGKEDVTRGMPRWAFTGADLTEVHRGSGGDFDGAAGVERGRGEGEEAHQCRQEQEPSAVTQRTEAAGEEIRPP